MAPQIAFLGMGGIAQAMTKSLVLYGNLDKPLKLFNRTKSRAEEHSATIGHSTVAATLEEAVSNADIIRSCLQDQEAVEATFDSILKMNIQGKLFVDSSTITPEKTNSIARQVLEAGAEFVAMPVMGEPTMASKRLLLCIAAGSSDSVERIKPYVAAVTVQPIIDLGGEEHGMASLLKLMGNVLIMSTMETVAEVNVFAEKCGLGTDNMQKLMSAMFPNPPHAIYNRRMLSGDYYQGEPMVEVTKARSLASHVLNLARSSGASVKAYEVAVKHLETVEAHAGAKADITGMYGAVRLESGLSFKNEKP